MARNVFKYNEIPVITEKIVIEPPFEAEPQFDPAALKREEELRKLEEYTGPTVEDIKQEVAQFKNQFEVEKATMIKNAKEEADYIFDEAKRKAAKLVEDANSEAAKIVDDAKASATSQLTEARKKILSEKEDVQKEIDQLVNSAKEEGHKEGYEAGFQKGQEEVDRLVNKIHTIVGSIANKRAQILEQSEAQVIDLVLSIATRVVKTISESQKEVVIQNVKSALARIKSRSDIIIRVNVQDLALTTSKMKEFQESLEKAKTITIVEDATIEKGGCIVETDFGHIDARIGSQLREIEEKIRELAPVKIVETA